MTVGLSPVNILALLLPKDMAWLLDPLRLTHQEEEETTNEQQRQDAGHDTEPTTQFRRWFDCDLKIGIAKLFRCYAPIPS